MRVLVISAIDQTIYYFRNDLILELINQGFDVTVCATETNAEIRQYFKDNDIPFFDAGLKRNLNLFNIFRSTLFISYLIKKENIGIVHTNTPIGGLVGRLAAWIASVNSVLHTTGGWYFHENMAWWKRRIFVSAEKFLARITDYIFSVNKEDIQTAKKYNITPREEIVYSGPAGVNTLKFSKSVNSNELNGLRQELQISKSTQIIGFVGRIVKEKGVYEFLDVIKQLELKSPDSNFCGIIIGDGPAKEELESYILQTNIESDILFLGHRNDIPLLMNIFDVYLFPSYREGVPVSVLEAMSTERNVVTFDIRGCREAIENGKSGTIVPFKDIGIMSDAVLRYLKKEIDHGKQARERIKNYYTRSDHVIHQIPVYQKIRENFQKNK